MPLIINIDLFRIVCNQLFYLIKSFIFEFIQLYFEFLHEIFLSLNNEFLSVVFTILKLLDFILF